MKKAAVVLSAAVVMAMTAVAVPTPAEARGGWGWGPGIVGGLFAGALIGGLASSAYGYGPGYGYYGPGPGYGYYGAMRPATTAATPPHPMDMDMADHTTDIGGPIIVDIARLTIVRTTVRVPTGGGAAGRNQPPMDIVTGLSWGGTGTRQIK